MIHSGPHRLIEYVGCISEAPEGWVTIPQLCKATGKGRTVIVRLLRKGMKDGKIQKRMYMTRCGERQFPVPHYFMK
jgi:hypothetical protein